MNSFIELINFKCVKVKENPMDLFRFLYVADKGVKNIHLFAIEKTFYVNKILIFINFNPKLDTFIERISLKMY